MVNLKKKKTNKLNQQVVMCNFHFQEGALEFAQKEACWTG